MTLPGGQPAPAYVVRGDDPSLVSQATRTLVDELVGGDAAGLAVEDLTAGDTDVGVVIDACLTPPFLVERRVVVVREAGRLGAEDAARLAAYLGDPSPTTALVLAGGGGQLSQKVVNAVKKVGHVVEAARPSSSRARGAWLADHLRSAPVQLDSPALALLDAHLGEDLARFGGLVDALAAVYGEGHRVTVEQLGPFLGEAGGIAPWELTDPLDRGETEAAIAALHRLLGGGGRHPLVVMATLHRHYASMLRLDGAGVRSRDEAAALLGMSPFPAEKAWKGAKALGSAKIAEAIALLAAADLDLRGVSGLPDTVVLEILVARLSRLAGSRAATRARR